MENATPIPAKLLKQLKDTKLPKTKQKDYPNLLQGNPGNDGGRPIKYDPKFVQELDVYLATAKLPTVEGFALHLKVDDTTLLNWANKVVEYDDNGKTKKRRLRPEFFATIKRLKMLQKNQLMSDGLYGYQKVNPIMAIFLLKVNHNMVETSNLDLTSKGKELPTPIYGGQSTK